MKYQAGAAHLSLCVPDLHAAQLFYDAAYSTEPTYVREDSLHYVIYGNHVVLREESDYFFDSKLADVDGSELPVPHFGFVVTREDWDGIVTAVQTGDLEFSVPPITR